MSIWLTHPQCRRASVLPQLHTHSVLFFQLFSHSPGAIWALVVVLIDIPWFLREVGHFPICILILLDFLFCEYLFSSFTGLEGETRYRASRRMCESCQNCPTCPHSPSSTCGSVQPCLRRSWTKLFITLWKTAGERKTPGCALPPPAGLLRNCTLSRKAPYPLPPWYTLDVKVIK